MEGEGIMGIRTERRDNRLLVIADDLEGARKARSAVIVELALQLGDSPDPANPNKAVQGVSMNWHPRQDVHGFYVSFSCEWRGVELDKMVASIEKAVRF